MINYFNALSIILNYSKNIYYNLDFFYKNIFFLYNNLCLFNIFLNKNLPYSNNSAMDGYAFRYNIFIFCKYNYIFFFFVY